MNVAREPVSLSAAVQGVLVAGVGLVAIFVPGLTPLAQAAILLFGNSLIILGGAIYSRSKVTPVVAPVLPAGTAVVIEGTNIKTTV